MNNIYGKIEDPGGLVLAKEAIMAVKHVSSSQLPKKESVGRSCSENGHNLYVNAFPHETYNPIEGHFFLWAYRGPCINHVRQYTPAVPEEAF